MCNEGKRIASAKEGEDAPLVAKWSSVKSRRVESMYLFNLFDRGRKPSRRFGDNRSHLAEPNASRSARADFSFPISPLSPMPRLMPLELHHGTQPSGKSPYPPISLTSTRQAREKPSWRYVRFAVESQAYMRSDNIG